MLLKKLLKLIIKKGKKEIAVKNLNKTLRVMRPYTPPSEVNYLLFKKLAPLVKIYKKKVAGKVYQLPWRTTKRRATFQAAKWIMLGVESERKGKDLSVKLGKQFVKTLKDKGLPLKLKGQFVDVIRENRSYMRFIKRKRIKKKSKKLKGRFKNRFTKKSIVNDIYFRFYKKKKYGKDNSKKVSSKNKKQRR